MTEESLLRELIAARERREPCVLATVATVRGSVPRAAGAKAIIFGDGRIIGTVGGGKFESLVAQDAVDALAKRETLLKSYPLHENSPASFGAICGGEVTVLLEPQLSREALVVFGAGHCGQSLCKFARECGWHVTVLDDRPELLAGCDAHIHHPGPAADFISHHPWCPDEALVLVSRNFQFDRDALAAALAHPGYGYLGMIGSTKKVGVVFDDLRKSGVAEEMLSAVRAPVGLDLGADAPAEIAVSVLAEIMTVLRRKSGLPLGQRVNSSRIS
jgi:xanthine dehydrogenase accessory factor